MCDLIQRSDQLSREIGFTSPVRLRITGKPLCWFTRATNPLPLVRPTMAEQRSLVTAPRSRGTSGSLQQNTSGESHFSYRHTIARPLPQLKIGGFRRWKGSMKTRLANPLVIGVFVSAFVFMLAPCAIAQQAKEQGSAPPYAGSGKAASKALPDGGLTPRLPDGHPDFSGIWFVGSLGKEDALLVQSAATAGDPALKPFDPKVTPEERPSFQPWAAEKVKQLGRGPARGELSKMTKAQQLTAVNTEIGRLERECVPHGVPGITLIGAMHGMELVET